VDTQNGAISTVSARRERENPLSVCGGT